MMNLNMENTYYTAVREVVIKAVSQDVKIIKEVEHTLLSLETQSEFYSVLVDIGQDQRLPINVRLFSLLYLKNNIRKYLKIASDEGNIQMIQKLLSVETLNEPNDQIAELLALIIKTLHSRHDKPFFQLFIPFMRHSLESSSIFHRLRSLLLFRSVFKSKIIFLGMEESTSQDIQSLMPIILSEWKTQSKLFLEVVKSDIKQSVYSLKTAHLCLKSLYDPCVFSEDVAIPLLLEQIELFLPCRINLLKENHLLLACEKYIILLLKKLLHFFEIRGTPPFKHLHIVLEGCTRLCFSKDFQGLLFEGLTIYLLTILVTIVLSYGSFTDRRFVLESNNFNALQSYEDIQSQFFTSPVLKEIIDQLTSKYLLLTEADMNFCENDAESYAYSNPLVEIDVDAIGRLRERLSELKHDCKASVRACAELLFFSLYEKYQRIMEPILLEFVNNAPVNSADDLIQCFLKLQLQHCSVDVPDILRKEAVYTVLGLGANPNILCYDFGKWLSDVLIPELKIKSHGYCIVRIRVVWILEKWKKFINSMEDFSSVFETVLLAMNDENLSVRITAAKSLKSIIDLETAGDFKWTEKLPEVLTAICNTYLEVQLTDLKVVLMKTFARVILKAGNNIHPHIASIVQFFMMMWAKSGGENHLQSAIISCYTQIVKCLGAKCVHLQSVLVPLIHVCINDSNIHLLEDGLDLWLALLENISICFPEIMDLCQRIKVLFVYMGEFPEKCIAIINAYLYLSLDDFLNRCGEEITKEYELSYQSYELLHLQFFWSGSGYGGFKVISKEDPEFPTICWIPKKCKEDFVSYQLRQFKFLPKEGSWIFMVVETAMIFLPEKSIIVFRPIFLCALDLVLHEKALLFKFTFHLKLISRIIVYSLPYFTEILTQKANELKKSVNEVFAVLIDVFVKKLSSAENVLKKLLALSLITVIPSNYDVVYSKMNDILTAVTKAISKELTSPLKVKELERWTTVTNHQLRKRKAIALDVVYNINLRDYFQSQSDSLRHFLGKDQFDRLASTIDQKTLKHIDCVHNGRPIDSDESDEEKKKSESD